MSAEDKGTEERKSCSTRSERRRRGIVRELVNRPSKDPELNPLDVMYPSGKEPVENFPVISFV